jgi:putative phosphoesterase
VNDLARIGIISDTHGLFHPKVVEHFQGCDLILHAGDIGKAEVLTHLEEIAPVKAVRGNVDKGKWSEKLPWIEETECEGRKLLMIVGGFYLKMI